MSASLSDPDDTRELYDDSPGVIADAALPYADGHYISALAGKRFGDVVDAADMLRAILLRRAARTGLPFGE